MLSKSLGFIVPFKTQTAPFRKFGGVFFHGNFLKETSTFSWGFRKILPRYTVDGRNLVYPIIYRVLYIPGGAGFQPSTVVKERGCFCFASWIAKAMVTGTKPLHGDDAGDVASRFDSQR